MSHEAQCWEELFKQTRRERDGLVEVLKLVLDDLSREKNDGVINAAAAKRRIREALGAQPKVVPA